MATKKNSTLAQPTYVKYTPAKQLSSGASSRVIQMVEVPKDPIEPPKFKTKRVTRRPSSPPVPVMHSPPRKLSAADQKAWAIPPCISDWKNSHGYTIPIDKRVASGRDLQDTQLSDKFAQWSYSLYVAERTARDEVAKRAEVIKFVCEREKALKEDTLRKLAEAARAERKSVEVAEKEETERWERDLIRLERKRERTRELRMEASGKKGKRIRDEDRDISERVALGQVGGRWQTDEALYDQRLFNQSQGLSGGFAEDEAYSVYSKPLFAASSSTLFRPSASEEGDTSKSKPHKDFEGVDRKHHEPRRTPVEFEKQEPEADLFGLAEFLATAKKATGKKSPERPVTPKRTAGKKSPERPGTPKRAAGKRSPLDEQGSKRTMYTASPGRKQAPKRTRVDILGKK